ncbi:MAG: anaerobic ribonucleoside-triphosphate reductase activating protein [Desulfotomaculales bacterium]
MEIGGLVKLSLVDWPGEVAAVIFTRRCNFRCPWCHNRDLVEPLPSSPVLPESEVLSYLSARRQLLSGVVISGGEPTLQDDLAPFLARLKEMGYAVKLDTNGSRPNVLRSLLKEGLVDRVAVDYKVPLSEYPIRVGWAVPDSVYQSLQLVMNLGCGEVRTTVVPGIHSPALLRRMVNELKIDLRVYRLQPFRPGSCLDPKYDDYPAVSREDMAVLEAALRNDATASANL